ncbi:TIR domain-containing protein [Solwaraspora sp. WMMB335]|uniref:TIR domain-containing protein n=1 Tax=Solwaraspora sp. WMMB335 TaxID=3404118 RepID=UPI003B936709
MAQAVVVILTPDDIAQLHPDMHRAAEPDHEGRPAGQARPEVIYEAGMAMGMHRRDRTLLVEIGELRPFAGIGGRDNTGCPVDDSDPDWLNVARFTGLAACARKP